jgi:hypothetical protein
MAHLNNTFHNNSKPNDGEDLLSDQKKIDMPNQSLLPSLSISSSSPSSITISPISNLSTLSSSSTSSNENGDDVFLNLNCNEDIGKTKKQKKASTSIDNKTNKRKYLETKRKNESALSRNLSTDLSSQIDTVHTNVSQSVKSNPFSISSIIDEGKSRSQNKQNQRESSLVLHSMPVPMPYQPGIVLNQMHQPDLIGLANVTSGVNNIWLYANHLNLIYFYLNQLKQRTANNS